MRAQTLAGPLVVLALAGCWMGAVVAPSGKLYFIPASHPRVLEVCR